jgi:RNA polymerase sigma-70 factor (ECF subfamily)
MSKGTNDPWAAEVIARHRPWLLATAKRICRNGTSDAEDLVQETCLRFFHKFGHLSAAQRPDEAGCGSWLKTTFKHLFLDLCRAQKVRAQDSHNAKPIEELPVAQETDPRPVYDALTDEQFAQALDKLGPKLRTTLDMNRAGKSYKDIALALDIPVGTVAKRLHDAREKLRDLLLPFTSGMN